MLPCKLQLLANFVMIIILSGKFFFQRSENKTWNELNCRDQSPVSSEFSDSSRASSEYFSCNSSETGSYADSDILSVSSEDSGHRSSRSSTKKSIQPRLLIADKTLLPSRKRKIRPLSQDAKRNKISPDKCSTANRIDLSNSKKESSTLCQPSQSAVHRRKKTTPVKLVLSTSGEHITMTSKDIKYGSMESKQLIHYATRSNIPLQEGSTECVRRSPRSSLLSGKQSKPTSKLKTEVFSLSFLSILILYRVVILCVFVFYIILFLTTSLCGSLRIHQIFHLITQLF